MKRKQHSKDFKAKVAIEARKGEKTKQELSAVYKVHPNMIATWKNNLRKVPLNCLTENPIKTKLNAVALRIYLFDGHTRSF